MGHSSSSKLVVGLTVDRDDFLSRFKVEKADMTEEERERFDGPPSLAGDDVWRHDGKLFDDIDVLLDSICRSVARQSDNDIVWAYHGNFCRGDELTLSFEVRSQHNDDKMDFEQMRRAMDAATEMAKVFRELGIDLGEPAVHSLSSYG